MGECNANQAAVRWNCFWPHSTRAQISSAKELAGFFVPISREQFKYSSTRISAEAGLGLIMLDFSLIHDENSGGFRNARRKASWLAGSTTASQVPACAGPQCGPRRGGILDCAWASPCLKSCSRLGSSPAQGSSRRRLRVGQGEAT